MRAAFTSQSVPVQTMLCQLWRSWPIIETTLGEFPVSARVLALMPATAPMFPTLGSYSIKHTLTELHVADTMKYGGGGLVWHFFHRVAI